MTTEYTAERGETAICKISTYCIPAGIGDTGSARIPIRHPREAATRRRGRRLSDARRFLRRDRRRLTAKK